jgi:hypothetical protein
MERCELEASGSDSISRKTLLHGVACFLYCATNSVRNVGFQN